MDNFIIFLLATSGITIIITHSKFFKPFRNLFFDYSATEESISLGNDVTPKGKFYNFLICPLCVGVWVGVFVRILMFIMFLDMELFEWGDIFNFVLYIDVFLHGAIGGLVSLFVLLVLNKLGFDKL